MIKRIINWLLWITKISLFMPKTLEDLAWHSFNLIHFRGGNSKEGLVKTATSITENLMALNRKISDQVTQSESTKSTLCK